MTGRTTGGTRRAIMLGGALLLLAGLVWAVIAGMGMLRGHHRVAGAASGAGSAAGATSGSAGTPPGVTVGSATPPAVPIPRFGCPAATVTVSTAQQLTAALAQAQPGEAIRLHDGVYAGEFTATVSGRADAPIYLCGGRGAVLQGASLDAGYALHLDGASHWRIDGFTVRHAQKGVVLDGSTDVGLQNLIVEQTGDEGVHLRRNSTEDVLRGLTVRDTGKHRGKFGEGVYVGSSKSNWAEVGDGGPDRSDHDFVIDSTISRTTAESVDIKEGTTGGVLEGNHFDGTGMTSAQAWVNVKGNGWSVIDNHGVRSPKDGYQTHVELDGWGQGNVFSRNTADLHGSTDGVGIYIHHPLDNRVGCDNTTLGGLPRSNIECSD